MNGNDVIRMARQVWGKRSAVSVDDLERFAELVAAHEREECADIADQHASAEGLAQTIAAAIRARGAS